MHAFDRVLFRRSLALTVMAVVLALGVVLATDEAFSTWQMRVARMSAFAPALAGVGAGAALAHARARGELRALAALGVSPWRSGLGPMLVGWGVGLASIALLATPLAEASVLFPRVAQSQPWTWHDGLLVSAAHGVRVAADGHIELGAGSPASGAGFAASGALAVLAVGPLAAATPAWVTAPIGVIGRCVILPATIALAVVVLHAVAAQRLDSAWLVTCAVPLGAQALRSHLVR
jgi:hypothetical protein